MKRVILILFIIVFSQLAIAQSYLPLSGGTLTGPLNGTSSTFSGNVTGALSLFSSSSSSAGQFDGTGNTGYVSQLQLSNTTSNSASRVGLTFVNDGGPNSFLLFQQPAASGSQDVYFYYNRNAALKFVTNGTERFNIDGNGGLNALCALTLHPASITDGYGRFQLTNDGTNINLLSQDNDRNIRIGSFGKQVTIGYNTSLATDNGAFKVEANGALTGTSALFNSNVSALGGVFGGTGTHQFRLFNVNLNGVGNYLRLDTYNGSSFADGISLVASSVYLGNSADGAALKISGDNTALYGSLTGTNASFTGNISSTGASINGNIKTKKLIVTQTGWSDYVFNDGYRLRPLAQVADFIKEKKHLPDVPTAKEIAKDGVDVGATQAVLLKKIEELTLYMIEQQKSIDALKAENQQIKKQLKKQNKK